MKITFVEVNQNVNTGSYRIWVKDLSTTLSQVGVQTRIVSNNESIESDSDVVIYGKSATHLAKSFENTNNAKIGGINFPCDFHSKDFDFVIVGSHEEKISMSYYDNVFVYPLIERKFMNLPIKKHEDRNLLKICYHGHHPGLFKFKPHLRDALDELSHEIPIELHVITGQKHFPWKFDLGKPSKVNVYMHGYDENFSRIVSSCDIGVVPNVCDMRSLFPGIEKTVNHNDLGLYNTDFFIRFKNKTNPGRAYVFYQHGIPVIHDLSPSSFDFMSKTGDYIFAHDKLSWIRQIKSLCSSGRRQEISERNRKTFDTCFSPVKHAKLLLEFINNMEEI